MGIINSEHKLIVIGMCAIALFTVATVAYGYHDYTKINNFIKDKACGSIYMSGKLRSKHETRNRMMKEIVDDLQLNPFRLFFVRMGVSDAIKECLE